MIDRGAAQLGWELDKLLEMTLQAMAATEDIIIPLQENPIRHLVGRGKFMSRRPIVNMRCLQQRLF